MSGDKVFEDLFSLTDETEMGHIELSRSADLVVVAPATADLLAKAAHGLANDLASTLLLASDKPILAAPAMNVRMWKHPATRRNRAQLAGDGVKFIGPNRRRDGLRRIRLRTHGRARRNFCRHPGIFRAWKQPERHSGRKAGGHHRRADP